MKQRLDTIQLDITYSTFTSLIYTKQYYKLFALIKDLEQNFLLSFCEYLQDLHVKLEATEKLKIYIYSFVIAMLLNYPEINYEYDLHYIPNFYMLRSFIKKSNDPNIRKVCYKFLRAIKASAQILHEFYQDEN